MIGSSKTTTRTLATVGLVLGAMTVASSASAQDASPAPAPAASGSAEASGSVSANVALPGGAPASAEHAEAPPPKDAGEDRVHVRLDATFGFGRTDVLNQRIVGPLVTEERRDRTVATYATQSFLLGVDVGVVKNVSVGAQLPLSTGSVYPTDSETRGSTALGNFTIGGAYDLALRKDMHLRPSLDVALPTAQGEAVPSEDRVGKLDHVKQADFDRFAIQRGAAASRGREDIASFTPKHLGLVPKVALTYKGIERLEIEPYVKYQSLHATTDSGEYAGAFVVAVRGSYRFHKNVDGTLRLWTDVPVTGDDDANATVEPQIRGHFGSVMPVVGVVVPFAGRLTDPQTVGLRVAIAAGF